MTLAVPSQPTAAVSSRVWTRYAVVAATVLLCAHVHIRRPPTFCIFRAMTGVPCPFCGGTTSAVAAARGNLRAAFAASPIALPMLAAFPWVGRLRTATILQGRAARWSAIGAVLLAAEVWQLARFGLLHG